MHLQAGFEVQSVGSRCKNPEEKCTFKPALGCCLWVQGAKILRKNAPSSQLWGAVCSAEVLFSYQYFALTINHLLSDFIRDLVHAAFPA